MSSNGKSNTNPNTVLYLIYFSIIALVYAASFFPDERVWGYNILSFVPEIWKYSILGIALIAPLIIKFISDDSGDNSERPDKSWLYLYSSVGLIILFAISFYLLRSTTHFLGDGYMVLGDVANDSAVIKPRNFGEILIHRFLYSLLIDRVEEAALWSYQSLSIASGIIALVITALSAKKLFENIADRLLFLVGISSGGFMLLYFGYVENYSIFITTVLAFLLSGMLAAKGKVSVVVPTVVVAVGLLLHIFGTILVPALVFLLVITLSSKTGASFFQNKSFWKYLTFLFVVSVAVFVFLYKNFLFFRFAVLPFGNDRFVLDGYSLFSIKHLLDLLNQLIIIIPALPLLLYFFFKIGYRKLIRNDVLLFLAILSSSALAALFIFDPKLGMARDWDLFAFIGLTLLCMLIYSILEYKKQFNSYFKIVLFSIMLGWVILVARLYINVMPPAAIKQVRSYYKMDTRKSMQHVQIVNWYAIDHGLDDIANDTKKFWLENYPEKTLNFQAKDKLKTRSYNEVINLTNQAIKINPLYALAYYNQGLAYMELKRYDRAKEVLEIAAGLNPYNLEMYLHLGITYFQLSEIQSAENVLLKAFDLDSTDFTVLNTLKSISKIKRDNEQVINYRKRIVNLTGLAEKKKIEFLEHYLNKGDKKRAEAAIKEFYPNGLSAEAKAILGNKFPEVIN